MNYPYNFNNNWTASCYYYFKKFCPKTNGDKSNKKKKLEICSYCISEFKSIVGSSLFYRKLTIRNEAKGKKIVNFSKQSGVIFFFFFFFGGLGGGG